MEQLLQLLLEKCRHVWGQCHPPLPPAACRTPPVLVLMSSKPLVGWRGRNWSLCTSVGWPGLDQSHSTSLLVQRHGCSQALSSRQSRAGAWHATSLRRRKTPAWSRPLEEETKEPKRCLCPRFLSAEARKPRPEPSQAARGRLCLRALSSKEPGGHTGRFCFLAAQTVTVWGTHVEFNNIVSYS